MLTREQIDAAVRDVRSRPVNYEEPFADSRAIYRAGIVAGLRLAMDLPGNPNTVQRDTIRAAADKLEKP